MEGVVAAAARAEEATAAEAARQRRGLGGLQTLSQTRVVDENSSNVINTASSSSRQGVTSSHRSTTSSSSSSSSTSRSRQQPQPNRSTSTNESNRGLQFQIFSETSGTARMNTEDAFPIAEHATWGTLGTETQRRKENTGPITKWSDGPLTVPDAFASSQGLAHVPVPTVSIFVDEAFAGTEGPFDREVRAVSVIVATCLFCIRYILYIVYILYDHACIHLPHI